MSFSDGVTTDARIRRTAISTLTLDDGSSANNGILELNTTSTTVDVTGYHVTSTLNSTGTNSDFGPGYVSFVDNTNAVSGGMSGFAISIYQNASTNNKSYMTPSVISCRNTANDNIQISAQTATMTNAAGTAINEVSFGGMLVKDSPGTTYGQVTKDLVRTVTPTANAILESTDLTFTSDTRLIRSAAKELTIDDAASGNVLVKTTGNHSSTGTIFTYNNTYSTGTASQATTTVTGVGTSFTSDMVGGTIVFANKSSAVIYNRNSATNLTVFPSQTVTSQAYTIYYGGGSTNKNGDFITRGAIMTSSNTARTEINPNVIYLGITGDVVIEKTASATLTVRNATPLNAVLRVDGELDTEYIYNLSAYGTSLGSGKYFDANSFNLQTTLYNTGTASQSTTVVTGSGTTFTSSMVGGTIIWTTGEQALITAFTSTTSLTVGTSQTVASGTYSIRYGGTQMNTTGLATPQLLLPTSGGTPAGLNYYEENYTHTTNWTGPWTATQTSKVTKLTRIGNIVNMRIQYFAGAASVNTFITMTTNIPSRFRPPSYTIWAIPVIDNTTDVMGLMVYDNGVPGFQVYLMNFVNFTASGSCGFDGDINVSWMV